MPSRKQILRELGEARSALLDYVNSLPKEAGRAGAAEGWTRAQILEHLSLAESATLTALRRAEKASPHPHRLTLRQRHLPWPAAVVRYPVARVKAPAWVRPDGNLTQAQALERLAKVRQQTHQYIEAHTDKELSALPMRHPFLGWMSAAQAFRLVAAHERRHLAQIRRQGGPRPTKAA